MGTFQKRLLIAFAALAIVSIIQGAVGLWAINLAVHNVQRGRVASDLLTEFIELSANKQRLRNWFSQALLNARPDPQIRARLLHAMSSQLASLKHLANQAEDMDRANAATLQEHAERLDALTVLNRSMLDLQVALADVQPLPVGTDPQTAWQAISKQFDLSEGRDLRTLLAESIKRERHSLARDRARADASLRLLVRLAVSAMLTLAIGSVLLAIYFTRTLRKPLDDLSTGALQLQSGNLLHRIPDSRHLEFSRLAHSVNTMAGELYLHRVREAEARQHLEFQVQERTNELELAVTKLEKLDLRRRQLFADISHELRTPTTAIRGEAEVTLRGSNKPIEEYKIALTRIVSAAQQLGLVIDDLLTMARSDIDMLTLERALLEVSRPLREAIAHVEMLGTSRQVRIAAEFTAVAQVLGDEQRLRQLFTLLLDNAVRYSHADQVVTVSTQVLSQPLSADTLTSDALGADALVIQSSQSDSSHSASNALTPAADMTSYWVLSVVDHGIGISGDDMPHMFERNYRSQAARQLRPDGNGLGLHIAAALAKAHGGHIEIHSVAAPDARHGTTVRVWLPLANDTQGRALT